MSSAKEFPDLPPVTPGDKDPTKNASQDAEAEGKRRGRKRGKHNFEPGYKDLLFEEWNSFMQRHKRCPKPEEVLKISDEAFRIRREALLAEDVNHPHLSILEAPLDAIQVKNLVNNEKRRRSKLASHGGAYEAEAYAAEEVAGPGPGSFAGKSIVDVTPPSAKRRRSARSPLESEADSQSQNTAVTAAAGISSLLERLQGRHRAEHSEPASMLGARGAGLGGYGLPAGMDVRALHENLQQLLASQLQKMTPQQQLGLWQMHQQQQQQQQAQQPPLQQALASLLGMQAPAPMSIPGIPGMYNNLSLPHSLLTAVLQPQPPQPPQPQPPQLQNPLSAFTSLTPSNSTGFGSSINPAPGPRPDSTPSYQQMMQLVQMLQTR